MGKFQDISLRTMCKLGAIKKIFITRLSRFGAIIKFWDKIYTHDMYITVGLKGKQFQKIFGIKYLPLFSKLSSSNGSEKSTWHRIRKQNFTSPMVLRIFFSGQIFLILKFKTFKLKNFLRP